MAENNKENLSYVGYGVLGSAIVFLVYDVIQTIIEKGLTKDVEVKFIAFTIAILAGLIFTKMIPKIKRVNPLYLLITVFVILGITIFWLIFVVSLIPITINTDWSSYAGSEIITVSGKVNPILSNEKILIKVFYPNGQLYNSTKVSLIDNSNVYVYHFSINPLGYNTMNVFTVNATYLGYTASKSFEYEDNRFPNSYLSP